jgi:hypothetical protein
MLHLDGIVDVHIILKDLLFSQSKYHESGYGN